MQERENALKDWLKQIISHDEFILTPLAGDASFRTYYRIQYNGLVHIIMDAPPDKEDLKPFIHVTHLLTQAKVFVPKILAVNMHYGFLLLSDLGDTLLLKELRTDTVDAYYKHAINTLLRIQSCPVDDVHIPPFNKAFMLKEMSLCTEWFLQKYLSLELLPEELFLLEHTMDWIAEQLMQQPTVFIHRDYHSRNLMCALDKGQPQLAVIDYQDAMYGPITYDLVSLLKDCYISWPREQVLDWIDYFYKQSPLAARQSKTLFVRGFDLCGLQRHLKVLGVFSRLYLRDGKAGYLADLPLVLKYVLECSELYEELLPLGHVLQKRVCLP